MQAKYILGIESSCDDTGIALIKGKKIISNVVLKQEHKKGVIPEYAARAHHVALFDYAKEIIKDNKIDLIAYTQGPGLIGSLFVGSSFAKGLAYSLDISSFPVNHLHAHILIPYWLYEDEMDFPYICLLVSGGHTMLVLVEKINGKFHYEVLSKTLDDAVGEMIDKVARNIGLDYPGGPHVETLAEKYDSNSYDLNDYKFPYAMKGRADFSFSGIKTAAIEQIDETASKQNKAKFCYLLQEHIAILLADKLEQTVKNLENKNVKHVVISGGVASNKVIRTKIKEAAQKVGCKSFFPPINLCTDNGVMIACVASLHEEVDFPSSEEMLAKKPYAQMVW